MSNQNVILLTIKKIPQFRIPEKVAVSYITYRSTILFWGFYIMSKKVNIKSGLRFGKLRIVREDGHFLQPGGQRQRAFICECDCGRTKRIRLSFLRANRTSSCGCIVSLDGFHGGSKTKLYWVWNTMKNRCQLKISESYHLYGARGITVCKKWVNSFSNFREWALKNGYRDKLQLDRKENNKGYSPMNCRFVTQTVNANNKRNTTFVNYEGKEYTFMNLMRHLGIDGNCKNIKSRFFCLGWNISDSINKPLQKVSLHTLNSSA